MNLNPAWQKFFMETKKKFAEIYIPFGEEVYLLELFYDDNNDHHGKINIGEAVVEYKRDQNKSIEGEFSEMVKNYFSKSKL